MVLERQRFYQNAWCMIVKNEELKENKKQKLNRSLNILEVKIE